MSSGGLACLGPPRLSTVSSRRTTCAGWSARRSTSRWSPTSGPRSPRLMRAEGARRVVIGHDMRDSSPSLAAAFADGVTGQGLDVVRIGLASTDQLYFASGLLDCPGAMFTASHNPAAYNGIKLCRAGAKPVGADTGLTVISDDLIAGVRDLRRAARDASPIAMCWPTTASSCVRWWTPPGCARCGWPSTPATAWPVTPRRRCSARSTRSPCCRCTSSSTARFPTTRPTRSTRPTWWTCRPMCATPAPTSGWPSTATPTGASWSTNAAGRSRRRR